MLRQCALVALMALSLQSMAQANPSVGIIEAERKTALWLNPGLYSYHYDQSKDFNAINIGFGAEYQFSTVASITAGFYRNSYSNSSKYLGAYWQPLAVGPLRVGMVAGLFNGYDNTNNGGWFPAVLPAISLEGDWLGCNVILIPTIPNRISGSISVQLKVKVWD